MAGLFTQAWVVSLTKINRPVFSPARGNRPPTEAADLVRHRLGLYVRTTPSASQRNTAVKNRKARIA